MGGNGDARGGKALYNSLISFPSLPFFLLLFFSLSLPHIHNIPIFFFFFLRIALLLCQAKGDTPGFCLEKLCVSNIPVFLKSLQVFRSLGGGKAGKKRCLGD